MVFQQARSEAPKCPGHASIELFGATDGDDGRILTAVLHHHRKYVRIKDERVGVHQKQIIAINLFPAPYPGRCHGQCDLALG